MNAKQYAKIETEVRKSLAIAHKVYSEMYKSGTKVTVRGENEIGTVDKVDLMNYGTMVGIDFNGRYAILKADRIQVVA